MQKLYRRLSTTGGLSIALGIVMLVISMVCGILTIITGASLLKSRERITF